MQAITISEYGGPEKLEYGEASMPEPGPARHLSLLQSGSPPNRCSFHPHRIAGFSL